MRLPALLAFMAGLLLASCTGQQSRSASSGGRKLTWPGKDLPSDRISAQEEAEAKAKAKLKTTSATSTAFRHSSWQRNGTGASSLARSSSALAGAGASTIIVIEEPIFYTGGRGYCPPLGYHHHGHRQRYRSTPGTLPHNRFRAPTRNRTIILDTSSSGRASVTTLPSNTSGTTFSVLR